MRKPAYPQNLCSPSNYNQILKKKVYENNNGNFTDPSLKQCLPYGKAGVGVLNCGREGREKKKRREVEIDSSSGCESIPLRQNGMAAPAVILLDLVSS